MKCPQCHQPVENGQKYCNNCGRRLDVPNEPSTTAPTPTKINTSVTSPTNTPPTTSSKNDETEKTPKKKKGSIVSWIMIIAFIGLGAYNSFEQKGIDKNNDALENFYAGDNQSAIQKLEEAKNNVIGDENKINTLKNLAYIYVTEAQIEQAENAFNEALALCEKDSFDYYLISGELALLKNDPANALANFDKALLINPNDYQLNNTLALFYIDLDEIAPDYVDYQKGLGYAKKAYELDQSEITKQNLAIAHFFVEDYDQTINLLLTSNLKQHPYAAFWLGLAYVSKEDHINAQTFFQTALDNGAELPPEVLDYMAGN